VVPQRLALDLSRTSVFLDFDGTVVCDDSGVYVLERLGRPGWQAVDDAYVRGAIGSRECLLDEWELLPKDEAQLRAVAREVPLDEGAVTLIDALQDAGAEVTVVSDGFGYYAEEVCASLGVALVTNAVDWQTGTLLFPNEDRCCPCSTCGTCKQAPIKDAARRGQTTVMVGDGASDRKAALLADVVFAKAGLAVWCSRNGVAYRPFDTLHDVRAALLS
jgi:2,3-diketo-5-methylthio-1-phosphopentane phosphatase